jgi:hypothetical protein
MFLTHRQAFIQDYILKLLNAHLNATGLDYGIDPLFSWMVFPYFRRLPLFFGVFFWPLIISIVMSVGLIAQRVWAGEWRKSVRTDGLVIWWFASILLFYAGTGGNHLWYIQPVVVPAALLIGRAMTVAGAVSKQHLPGASNVNPTIETVATFAVAILIVAGGVAGAPSWGYPPAESTETSEAQYKLAKEINEQTDADDIICISKDRVTGNPAFVLQYYTEPRIVITGNGPRTRSAPADCIPYQPAT